MVKVIDQQEYLEELYEVQVESFKAYPEKYRPTVDHNAFISELNAMTGVFLEAFSKDEQKFCGYTQSSCREKCIDFNRLKTIPQYENRGLNAALVYELLEYYKDDLSSGKYICNGSRSINHETHFQDYLEEYFGFRKAYCKLHVEHQPYMAPIIKIVYFFRKLLKRFDSIGVVHQVNAILTMESIEWE